MKKQQGLCEGNPGTALRLSMNYLQIGAAEDVAGALAEYLETGL